MVLKQTFPSACWANNENRVPDTLTSNLLVVHNCTPCACAAFTYLVVPAKITIFRVVVSLKVKHSAEIACCPQANITLLATCYYQANQVNRAFHILKKSGECYHTQGPRNFVIS